MTKKFLYVGHNGFIKKFDVMIIRKPADNFRIVELSVGHNGFIEKFNVMIIRKTADNFRPMELRCAHNQREILRVTLLQQLNACLFSTLHIVNKVASA